MPSSIEWLLKDKSEQIKEWERKESQLKRHRCDSDEELQRAEERLRRVKPKLNHPVSTGQFNDLVRLHYHHQALEWKAGGKGVRLSRFSERKFRHLRWDYDTFACDKSAYELFNWAMDMGFPLGRWVKRMLDVGSLITDVNYMERPGWRAWPIYGGQVCAEDARRYLRAVDIKDEDSQERLLPSMLAYMQCNRLGTNYVFVTGCKEFYGRVLLSKPTLQRLVDAFMCSGRVLLRSDYLVDRVWYVGNPMFYVPSSADEICVSENKIRCPEGCFNGHGSPWMSPGDEYVPRQKKSDFLPDEVLVSFV